MHVVVVGAGQAAAQAIETLRRRNFTGPITLIGDEPILPYQRPPLSKKLLSGELERDRLLIRHARYYGEHGITQLLGRRVVSIDCSARTVTRSFPTIPCFWQLAAALDASLCLVEILRGSAIYEPRVTHSRCATS
jgi:NAD(P)H-nitrite reductase large subunit